MSTCSVCGGWIYARTSQHECKCKERYEAEIATGIYPPGLTEDGRLGFSYYAWRCIKEYERWVREGWMTPDQARMKLQEIITRCNKHTEMRQKLDAQKDFSLY